ncbi:hypothetical protein [Crocinitomix algicola]|uniref:hypothetical protein n=1 Tax=Crocinitomix algicola TaxID=1740263 RepID=UPI00082E24E2|nr:hypothetical protein [Crocinitomix algicola]
MRISTLFIIFLILFSCKKEEVTDYKLPKGAIAFTDDDLNFVPYSNQNLVFKKAPDFIEELHYQFDGRNATRNQFAWDQTYFKNAADEHLRVELRLRHLKTTNITLKTLAIYMPYWDGESKLNESLFEIPLKMDATSSEIFSGRLVFHEAIDLHGTIWENVYEILPLLYPTEEEESGSRYSKLFYSTEFGLIQLNQVNGNSWILIP